MSAPTHPHRSIDDAAHGGNPGFHFLAPLVKASAHAGRFDPSVPVTVEVCEVRDGSCVARIAYFSSDSATGSARVSIDLAEEHYLVLWRTGEGGTQAGERYRVRVLTRGIALGYADVILKGEDDVVNAASVEGPIAIARNRVLPVKFRIEDGAAPARRATFGPSGGELHLPGYASIDIPAGALDATQAVSLAATALPETDADYRETLSVSTLHRSHWELRVTAGNAPPSGDMTISVEPPAAFISRLPSGQVPALWVQQYQDAGEDLLDGFVPLPATAVGGRLVGSLPAHAFTDQRTSDGVHEAIIIVGSVPGSAAAFGLLPTRSGPTLGVGVSGDDACRGSPLAPPMETPLTVTSAFGGLHKGVDYRAANGDRLLAPASGVVERIGWNVKTLTRPNPRSGLMVQGWGRYVRIRLDDGTAVLLAHLIENSTAHLREGMRVSAGDFIGLSDNTGGSTAPHLHAEHTLADGTPVDPHACFAVETTDFSGRWVGSLAGHNGRASVSGDWTWDLVQVGTVVTGTTSIGPLTGTVAGNVLSLTVEYLGRAGSTFKGSVALSGNTISGAMVFDFIAETFPITTTLTRSM